LGSKWRDAFVDFYFGERMNVGIEEACALPSFTSDVAQADSSTREAYEAELGRLIETIAAGFGDPPDRKRACAFLALLSGGASIARAVETSVSAKNCSQPLGQQPRPFETVGLSLTNRTCFP
jgi:TetR/AcrR family transcriptional repressor of nem operon